MNVKFIDTTGWQETYWLNSGGTREKHILQDENDDLYYFKRSERKPTIFHFQRGTTKNPKHSFQ